MIKVIQLVMRCLTSNYMPFSKQSQIKIQKKCRHFKVYNLISDVRMRQSERCGREGGHAAGTSLETKQNFLRILHCSFLFNDAVTTGKVYNGEQRTNDRMFIPSNMPQTVSLLTCNREVPGSNLSPNALQANSLIRYSVTSWQLTLVSFPIHYPLLSYESN